MDSLTLVDAKNKRATIKASATRLKIFIENFNMQQGSQHDLTVKQSYPNYGIYLTPCKRG